MELDFTACSANNSERSLTLSHKQDITQEHDMNRASQLEVTREKWPRPAQIVRTILTMLALIALAEILPAQQSSKIDVIQVEVGGLHSDKGQVICALFSSPKDFPKNSEKAVARAQSPIANGHAECEFSSVAPGKYAVAAFHDENSNGKMDTNFMG